jgi:cell division protein FtsI/penicillin-binding protein 2
MRITPQRPITRGSIRFDRLFVVRTLLLLIGVIFFTRLFYIQIINQAHYKQIARNEQFKQLQIEAERGSIYMRSSSDIVALAVNESRYTVFADPSYVKEPSKVAQLLSPLLSLPKDDLETKLKKNLRYIILAKKISKDSKVKIESMKLKGIAWKEERIRTYPQGVTGATVLGFVNDQGDGQYGVEGSLNNLLKGTPGTIRAVTDIQGIPLVQNKDNVVTEPIHGQDTVLTIDQTVQRIAEEEIKTGVEKTGAKSGSVVVMEAATGRVAAMADYPTYDPAQYAKAEDGSVFKNKTVSDPMEPGSIIKTLTVGAAIDSGAITKDSTYFDPGFQDIDGNIIKNVTNLGSGTRSIFDILRYSLNTGAIYMLKQMGGGDINEKARTTWYSYLSDHFLFTQDPKIEQDEATRGYIQKPTSGDGLRVQYANMSFGQGLSVTIQQFASALSASLNGGTYYQPTLVYGVKTDNGVVEQKPKVLKTDVVSKSTSDSVVELMKEYADVSFPEVKRDGFVLGGKTGTAQVPKTDGTGGYRTDVYNATFAGYIGRKTPKYVVILRLDEGSATSNFTGFNSAKPVFVGIANGIMDNVPISD